MSSAISAVNPMPHQAQQQKRRIYRVGTRAKASPPFNSSEGTIVAVELHAPPPGLGWGAADVWIELDNGTAAPWYYMTLIETNDEL